MERMFGNGNGKMGNEIKWDNNYISSKELQGISHQKPCRLILQSEEKVQVNDNGVNGIGKVRIELLKMGHRIGYIATRSK